MRIVRFRVRGEFRWVSDYQVPTISILVAVAVATTTHEGHDTGAFEHTDPWSHSGLNIGGVALFSAGRLSFYSRASESITARWRKAWKSSRFFHGVY